MILCPVFLPLLMSISHAHILSASYSLLWLWKSPFMWEGTVNECGWARGNCVGFPPHLSLRATEAWQGFGGWLKSQGKQTKNSFFPDGHCKREQNILCTFLEPASACIVWQVGLSKTTVVWWKSVYLYIFFKSQDPTWICNGPRCWSQCSICVYKSDKYKRQKFLSKPSGLKLEEERVNVYSVILPGFTKAAPINLCSNLWVSGMHSKLNCCLFYSAGVKAPSLPLNAIGGLRVPGCSTLLLTQHYSWKTRRLIYPSKMSR